MTSRVWRAPQQKMSATTKKLKFAITGMSYNEAVDAEKNSHALSFNSALIRFQQDS